jgi:hypothetical protein
MATTPRLSSGSATGTGIASTRAAQARAVWEVSTRSPAIGWPSVHDMSPQATTTRPPPSRYSVNVDPAARVAPRAAATTTSIAASPTTPPSTRAATWLRPSTRRW